MSLNTFVTCDCCNKEVLPEDAPHQTRGEFRRLVHLSGQDKAMDILPRRDLCESCAQRMHQTINTYLPDCHWLLEGFEVAK